MPSGKRFLINALPENCRPLCECHRGTLVETPREAKRFLDEAGLKRGGISVHAMQDAEDLLREWLGLFGEKAAHVHLYLQGENRMAAGRQRLGFLKTEGFSGSITIEFTEGVATPVENPEALFASALEDLCLVREIWSL